MLIVGLSWLIYWLLLNVFDVEMLKSALVTALIFIVLGLLTENHAGLKRPWDRRA